MELARIAIVIHSMNARVALHLAQHHAGRIERAVVQQDAPPMRSEAVQSLLAPLSDRFTVVPRADSGHYPMQEQPPLTVALVERFWGLDGVTSE
ncbi:MAG: hypothetical protein QM784_37320 [Polyangiaceae bacterium]